MTEFSNIGLFSAFLAGGISFLSPCVLPVVPGYISYIAGTSVSDSTYDTGLKSRLPALGLSLCFVLGFSTIFVLMGASATALGQLLMSYRYELNIVGGAIIIVFGVFMLGLLRVSWLYRDVRIHASIPGGRPFSAYLIGLAFAFGWTPCIGPILGAILTVSAASATVADGVTLLSVYSLGLGIPFLLTAAFTTAVIGKLRSFRRIGHVLQFVAGGALILVGIAMITGRLSAFSYWLLDVFPALNSIG